MANTSTTKYAGEDRGYGTPGKGKSGGGNLINGTNNTAAKNGAMNGAPIKPNQNPSNTQRRGERAPS